MFVKCILFKKATNLFATRQKVIITGVLRLAVGSKHGCLLG